MANLKIPRNLIDRIPADLRAELLAVLEESDQTEQSFDVFMDSCAKGAERHVQEITFMEAQIKGLLQAIRATKDVDSIAALPITTKETIERIRERKRQEELKRFAFPCFVPHHGQSL